MNIDESKYTEVPAYSKLAGVYDDLMAHVDYVTWIDYIDEILFRQKKEFCKLIDIACGTGTMVLLLKQRGYDACGSDGCKEMVEYARQKSVNYRISAAFYSMDMTEIELDETFDSVICLYDSLNYVLVREGIVNTFKRAWNLLNSEGIFIFDVCTEDNSLRFFDGYYDSGENDTYAYQRFSKYIKEHRIQMNTFYLDPKDNGQAYKEVHRQYIYTIDEIVEMIGKTGFTEIGHYHDFTFDEPNRFSERIHFVLKK